MCIIQNSLEEVGMTTYISDRPRIFVYSRQMIYNLKRFMERQTLGTELKGLGQHSQENVLKTYAKNWRHFYM